MEIAWDPFPWQCPHCWGQLQRPWRWHLLVQSQELCVGNPGWHRHSVSASWSPPSLCQSSLLGWNGRKGRQICVCKAVLWKWKSLGISKISIILSSQNILRFSIILHTRWDCPCEYYKGLFQLKMLQTPPLWKRQTPLRKPWMCYPLSTALVLAHVSNLSANSRAVVPCPTMSPQCPCAGMKRSLLSHGSPVSQLRVLGLCLLWDRAEGRTCGHSFAEYFTFYCQLCRCRWWGVGLHVPPLRAVSSRWCGVGAAQSSSPSFCSSFNFEISWFSTFVSLSWCCYDSLLGGLENCSRLLKFMQQLSGNLTYFRAALTWLRMAETELQQHKLPPGFGKKWFIMKIGGLCCEGE